MSDFTPAKAKRLLPVIIALANGETIQNRSNSSRPWVDVGPSDTVAFSLDPDCYRIKPRPTETYHYIFNDGSMSRGSVSIDQLNELYGHKSKGFTGQLVKLTRVDGKPVGIEVIE